jgi:hypothetical protein
VRRQASASDPQEVRAPPHDRTRVLPAPQRCDTAHELLATLPVSIFGVVVVGIGRARAAGRSPRPWGIVGLVALAAFFAYLLIATAVLHANE